MLNKFKLYTHKTLAIKFCTYIIELMEGNNANQPHLGDAVGVRGDHPGLASHLGEDPPNEVMPTTAG